MVIKVLLDIIGSIIFFEFIVCLVVDGIMLNFGVVDFGLFNFVVVYLVVDFVCNIVVVELNVVVIVVVD